MNEKIKEAISKSYVVSGMSVGIFNPMQMTAHTDKLMIASQQLTMSNQKMIEDMTNQGFHRQTVIELLWKMAELQKVVYGMLASSGITSDQFEEFILESFEGKGHAFISGLVDSLMNPVAAIPKGDTSGG